MNNIESDNAALIAATPADPEYLEFLLSKEPDYEKWKAARAALIAATPAVVPSPFSALLALLTTWEDEERGSARRLSAQSVEQAQYCSFARSAVLALQAAVADAQASGIHLARVELRTVMDRLAADAEKEEE